MADASIRVDMIRSRSGGLAFAEFPEDLRETLKATVEELAQELYARVVAAAPHKTGRLASEVRVRLFDDEEGVAGYVSVGTDSINELLKALTLEYGSTGTPRAYTPPRRAPQGNWLARLLAPRVEIERKLRESPNLPALRYERNTLAEMQPEIAARLNAAVEAAIARADA